MTADDQRLESEEHIEARHGVAPQGGVGQAQANSPAEGEAAAERRFRLVVEAAPNAMVMVNRTGTIVMVNAQAERVFGYPRAEMLGRSIELLVPAQFRSAHPQMRDEFNARPQARAMGAGRDLFALKKDGREFPVEIGLNPIETDEGPMVLAAVIDITERKAAELALRESEHRQRTVAAIVESSDDAIISVALDGLVISWNKSAERIFGYTEAEMIGQPIVRLAVPGYEAETTAFLDKIRLGGRIEHHETMRRRKDGAILHVSLTVSAIFDADGQLIGASEVTRDITAAKIAEAALQESQARLQQLNSELVHVSRLSAMGQMAAMVAHELNQPLTAISNYMEAAAAMLDRGGDPPAPRLKDAVLRASSQAVRAGQIIQQLRGFVARGDSQRRVEPISPLVREAVDLALLGLKHNAIDIRIEDQVAQAAVLADKIQIQQVLLNLLRNAAEAMADRERPDIVLITELCDKGVQISVADNGPGLPEEVQSRLFQPFVTTKKTGMGIGLSVCHSIAVAHNGHLWAEPNPGGGTIFRLVLPTAPADGQPDA